jgi:hypothetical protein
MEIWFQEGWKCLARQLLRHFFETFGKEEITLHIRTPAPFPATSLKWRDISQSEASQPAARALGEPRT